MPYAHYTTYHNHVFMIASVYGACDTIHLIIRSLRMFTLHVNELLYRTFISVTASVINNTHLYRNISTAIFVYLCLKTDMAFTVVLKMSKQSV